MIIDGKKRKVAQLSTVGTLPLYRGKGLSKKLISEAIEFCNNKHDFVFLFADNDAKDFYQKGNWSNPEYSEKDFQISRSLGDFIEDLENILKGDKEQ